MSEMFSEQGTLLSLVTLVVTFNMYAMKAETGGSPMGTFFHKYLAIIELANWLIFLGGIVYLSYLYTWWFLLSFFLFPVAGLIIASIFGGFTLLVYMVGMPILFVIAIIHVIK